MEGDKMTKYERICPICKGIINLKIHSYYILKGAERNMYYCKTCLEHRCRNCKDSVPCYYKLHINK